ncbi:unnamed protein product [Durusdinium trenchii]|uniref:Uncharacterized protein n=2 Tax=Durusdinium trenchii TaxID=1381693 RepID=A0ABP0KEX2_9DINO
MVRFSEIDADHLDVSKPFLPTKAKSKFWWSGLWTGSKNPSSLCGRSNGSKQAGANASSKAADGSPAPVPSPGEGSVVPRGEAVDVEEPWTSEACEEGAPLGSKDGTGSQAHQSGSAELEEAIVEGPILSEEEERQLLAAQLEELEQKVSWLVQPRQAEGQALHLEMLEEKETKLGGLGPVPQQLEEKVWQSDRAKLRSDPYSLPRDMVLGSASAGGSSLPIDFAASSTITKGVAKEIPRQKAEEDELASAVPQEAKSGSSSLWRIDEGHCWQPLSVCGNFLYETEVSTKTWRELPATSLPMSPVATTAGTTTYRSATPSVPPSSAASPHVGLAPTREPPMDSSRDPLPSAQRSMRSPAAPAGLRRQGAQELEMEMAPPEASSLDAHEVKEFQFNGRREQHELNKKVHEAFGSTTQELNSLKETVFGLQHELQLLQKDTGSLRSALSQGGSLPVEGARTLQKASSREVSRFNATVSEPPRTAPAYQADEEGDCCQQLCGNDYDSSHEKEVRRLSVRSPLPSSSLPASPTPQRSASSCGSPYLLRSPALPSSSYATRLVDSPEPPMAPSRDPPVAGQRLASASPFSTWDRPPEPRDAQGRAQEMKAASPSTMLRTSPRPADRLTDDELELRSEGAEAPPESEDEWPPSPPAAPMSPEPLAPAGQVGHLQALRRPVDLPKTLKLPFPDVPYHHDAGFVSGGA